MVYKWKTDIIKMQQLLIYYNWWTYPQVSQNSCGLTNTKEANVKFRYMDNALSFTNSISWQWWLHISLGIEVELTDVIDTGMSTSYYDQHVAIDSGWGPIQIAILQVKRWYQFSHYQHLAVTSLPSTCTWNIYLPVDTRFQSLWFLSGFPQ